MKGTMKAARLHRTREPVRVDEVPIPDIQRGEVLLRVLRAGSNGGDVHLVRGDFDPQPERQGGPRALLPVEEQRRAVPSLPMTIGHEGMGEVVEVGPEVYGLEPGDRVLAKPTLTCGFCKYCRTGREHVCVHHRVMGFTSFISEEKDIFQRYKDGLCAEYCRIPATNVERIRRDDDVDQFSLVSVVAVGFRALKRARLSVGETVIVNGASGVTGVPTVLAALALGAAHVIAIARDPGRLERVRLIEPRRISTVSIVTDSIRERVAELTNGEGANVLVDLNPDPHTLDSTLDCLLALEPCGRAAMIAGGPGVLPIGYPYLLIRQVEFVSSKGRFYDDYPKLIELTRRGVLDVSHIHPQFFKIEQINEAIAAVDRRGGGEPVWPMIRFD